MSFYYGSQHHSQHAALHSHHPHHSGRSRRQARASGSQHNNHHHKHIRALRIQKEAEESAMEKAFRRDFDAARSFDIEDDEIFCPFNLLTDDDLQSISSAGSDRSSLSSGSPEQSPLQPQPQATSTYLLPPTSATFTPAAFQHGAASASQTKLHQPLAQRSRNAAIAIVDPSTRTVASPPPSASVSPARQMQQQYMNSRRW
jgi:hypothetical protein